MPSPTKARREYGTGGITWLGPRRARLRVRVDGVQRTKVVRVAPRDSGGRGEAKVELDKFRAELAMGDAVEVAGHTLAEAIASYLTQCARLRSASTVESYENAAKRIPDALASKPLLDLTTNDLDLLYGDLGERLAVNTIRQTHAFLSATLTHAVGRTWIPSNPAARAKVGKRQIPKRKPLAPSDIARMIVAALGTDGKGDVVLAMAVALAAVTGERRGELAGMKWEDLDTSTGVLTIQRQWVPVKGGQREELPKGGEERTIILGRDSLDLIERYRKVIRDATRREPEGWLLSYDGGITPMRAKALGAAISKLGTDVGLNITTHSFRRVSATQLVAAGVDVDTAARRQGNTRAVMFDHYVLGQDDNAIAAATAVEDRLGAQGLPLGAILNSASVDAAQQSAE